MHHVAGRLRLRLPQLKQGGIRAAEVTATVRAIDGVISAEANPVTGSLLIFYDAASVESVGLWEALGAALAAHGYSRIRAAVPPRRDTGASRVSPVVDRFVGTLFDKLVEHSAHAVVASLL